MEWIEWIELEFSSAMALSLRLAAFKSGITPNDRTVMERAAMQPREMSSVFNADDSVAAETRKGMKCPEAMQTREGGSELESTTQLGSLLSTGRARESSFSTGDWRVLKAGAEEPGDDLKRKEVEERDPEGRESSEISTEVSANLLDEEEEEGVQWRPTVTVEKIDKEVGVGREPGNKEGKLKSLEATAKHAEQLAGRVEGREGGVEISI